MTCQWFVDENISRIINLLFVELSSNWLFLLTIRIIMRINLSSKSKYVCIYTRKKRKRKKSYNSNA